MSNGLLLKSYRAFSTRNASCRFRGKWGHFARIVKRFINWCAFGCFRCSCSVCQPTFPCFSFLNLSICRRTGELNDSPVQVLIDSGASENFIDLDVWARLNLPVNGERSSIGMASSEIAVETLGKTTADLKLLDQTYLLSNFRVLKNLCADIIVGQTFLKLHSFVIFVMNGQKKALMIAASSKLCNAAHTAVAAADLEPPHLFQCILPDCKPIAAPLWCYNSGGKYFIKSEVQRLLDADIIEPAGSPWKAQVLVVKQCEKKRLVMDYSVTINCYVLLDAYPLPNIEDLVNRIARDKYFSSIDLRVAYHQVPL